MPATLAVHDLLRPQSTQKSDLLLDPPAAVAEAHSQRFVLHLVPADASTDNEASARQNVHLCRLFCHERRLPLGENEDRCRELQPRCDRGEVAEQHEGLVERRAVVVGTGPAARAVGVSTEDVVEDHETVVSEVLDRAGVFRDHLGIGPDLELREYRARPHESQYRGGAVLRESAPADPGVRAEDAVEQHDESAFGGSKPTREVDLHDARPTEADGEAAIRSNDGSAEQARWGEARRTRADEELGLIGSDVHEVARVGPDAVEPEAAEYLDPPLHSGIPAVGTDTPDARVRDEDATRGDDRTDRAREEEDPTPVEERGGRRR